MTEPLAGLRFDDAFVRALPGDAEVGPRRREVLGACYSRVEPTPVAGPRLIAYSREVAALLGLSPAECETQTFADVMGGNRLLPGMQPYAACYGGHQFGSWAGQLGDGRAITLGELIAPDERRWEIQLKGAGLTPYSRTADGRAVLRSSVREFLCSEAMHHLGVPTTRALSLVGTGEAVVRDMFYDGRPQEEPGAIVCRVAPSFLRFGNFEIFAARGDVETLRGLADHAIRRHFPELGAPSADTYVAWFAEVCRRTVVVATDWMRVGFVHGVLNTDNMSVLGLTIDYGPYGWLEGYDPDWTPNTTDAAGRRYRYGYQPRIALWNLGRFGSAIAPLVPSVEPLQAVLDATAREMEARQPAMLRAKLGVEAGEDDDGVVDALPSVLGAVETDMTIFFRRLADVDVDDDPTDERLMAPLASAYYAPHDLGREQRATIVSWLRRWAACVRRTGMPSAVRRARMNATNPKYVLRNYLAQLAIDAAEQGDPSMVHELLEVLRTPYDEQPGRERFAEKRPEWARHRAGCSMLSCSS